MNKLFTLAALALSLHALTGCTAQAIDHEEPPPATEQSALIGTGGGGGGLSYSCEGLLCTCTGDLDCNDMFEDGICGPVASCDDTHYPPVCRCLKGLGMRKSAATRGAVSTSTTLKATAEGDVLTKP